MTGAISPNNSAGTAAAGGPPASSAPAAGSQVTKNMFLQLLVAQIKNQDPMSPSDGVQFLTQLAQFQQLEQSMNMGQDMTAVRTDLDKLVQDGTQINPTPTK
jgi:flagellar basal-body rod modification protein FlgD